MAQQSISDPSLPQPAGSEPRRPTVSRRQLLYTAAGGAALLATNTGTAVATHRTSTARAEARARVEIDDLQAEVRRLRIELALYEDMERIGLDHLIRGALDLYDRLWPPLRDGLRGLIGILGTVDAALSHFEAGLPTLRGAVKTLRELLGGLEKQTQGVQAVIGEILRRTAPIGEAVSGFLAWLLSKIPFGLGAPVLEASTRLSGLAGSIEPAIAEVTLRLLSPLDDDWLSAEEEQGLQGRLFGPLRDELLTPLRTHLAQADELSTQWDTKVAAPLRAGLADRQRIRQEISRLRQARGRTPAGNPA